MIKHYLNVYRLFVETSFAQAISFRTAFIILFFTEFFYISVTLANVFILFENVAQVGPWSREQFFFFTCFVLAVDNFQMAFINQNQWQFSDYLKLGNFDFILLKPLHSIFLTFFRYSRPAALLNTLFIWALVIKFGIVIKLSTIDWLTLPLLFVLAVILSTQLGIIICCGMFWLTEGNGINFVRMQIQSIGRWPDFIYQSAMRKFFFVFFPILLIGSAPSHFLFEQKKFVFLIYLVVANLISAILLHLIWKKGLNRYESASS